MPKRVADIVVGLFLIAAFLGFIYLAFHVSDISHIGDNGYYTISAEFDNVGGLKVRAPISVSGVKVGEVTDIALDRNNFRAVVSMRISNTFNNLPQDTAASIFTQGILGSNYISLSPGFEQENLKNHGQIATTHSALILENLIGQLIYSLKSDDKSNESKADDDGVSASLGWRFR